MSNSFFKRGFDLKKIKIKHLLGINKQLARYPDNSDILYFLIENASAKSDKDAYLYSDEMIGKRFEIEQEYAREILDELADLGYLKHVKTTQTKSIYELINNPYH
jgi:hypothetical protein